MPVAEAEAGKPQPRPMGRLAASELLLLAAVAGYVLLCPYAKVEESFNLQAVHDLLYHGADLQQYDHNEFPGVVPRTFIGASVLAALTSPLKMAIDAQGGSKLWVQYVARLTLGLICWWCFVRFSRQVAASFGPATACWLNLLSALQFHLPFYMSRTLPNTFAFALVMLAYAAWLRRQNLQLVGYLAVATAIFRSELVALAGPILLTELLRGRISLLFVLSRGIPAGLFAIAVSVLLDSVFWGSWLWPEGVVLYYNTVLNKSSDWGTQPYFWYWYSAIPRATTVSLPLAALGLALDRRLWPIVTPVAAFIFLYSLLPHKELRFIFYVFPIITLAAAVACERLWRSKSLQSLFRLGIVGALLASLAASSIFALAAVHNYPGGVALKMLQEQCQQRTCGTLQQPVYAHIGNLAAQTGASRFGETQPYMRFSKVEHWTEAEQPAKFDYLLAEPKDEANLSATHERIFTVEGFHRLDFRQLRVETSPQIVCLARKQK